MADGNDILVVVFLRGGCDGLNFVGPSADATYIAERGRETRVERDGDHPGLPLANHFADVDFRFHFKAQKLKELYDARHLAIVHASGLTNGTRSHFEAQDYMERGTPENKNMSSGWIARLVKAQGLHGVMPVIAASGNLPVSLLACSEAVAVPQAKRVQLQGDPHFRQVQESLLKRAYQGNTALARNGLRTLGVVDALAAKLPRDPQGKPLDYVPASGVAYPNDGYAHELGNGFQTVAQLVKMDLGVRIATIDFGGWDTHVDQGGRFPNQVDAVSRAMGAFWDDMQACQDRLTVVVMSEFGRRLKSNESHGTDHGHGNMMLVLGGGIRGGDIYGRWPGLANEQLDNGVDLAVTTDYRTVLAEVTGLAGQRRELVFPGLPQASALGIM